MTSNVRNIELIIWRKMDNDYVCYINNLNVQDNLKLNVYIETYNIDYSDSYKKIIETKEHQFVEKNNFRINLQHIDNNNFMEVHIPNDDSLYLLSCTSYKLRNPLTNMVGILTLVEEEDVNKNMKKYYSLIKDSTYEIVSIANDLIDIVNLKNAEVKLNFERTGVKKLLIDCKNIIIKDITKKKLDFKININKEVAPIIIIDQQRLTQILINLCNNSINFTSIGGISIEVSVFSEADAVTLKYPFKYIESKHPAYNLLFKVKDTGSGINSEDKKFVKKILGLSNKSYTQTNRHGGFGLLISKYLCNLMGGNIWFKTEKDMGTIFYVNIISVRAL